MHMLNDYACVYRIVCMLKDMNYECDSARDAIRIIESDCLDKSQFTFPGKSYDRFKRQVLIGYYDVSMDTLCAMTERRQLLQKAVVEQLLQSQDTLLKSKVRWKNNANTKNTRT